MDFYEHIEDYIEERLSKKDLSAFEAAMAEDDGLRYAVDNYDDTTLLAKGLLEIDVMESIEALNKTAHSSPASNKKDIGWPMWVLGALVLIGVILSVWNFMKSPPKIKELNTEVLYAQLYEEPMWPIERSGNNSYESKGAEAYLNDDIRSAEAYLLDSLENKDLGRYWLAEMYLKEGELEKVSTLIKELQEAEPSVEIDQERVLYLEVLMKVKEGDLMRARAISKELNERDYPKLYEILNNIKD